MARRGSRENLIHLRAIEYGMKFPNGFMYKNFQEHYRRRSADWKIVDEFFQEAYNNKNGASSRTTPFVLLERGPNGNADTSKYILSYEAYFNYLAYWNSKKAIKAAVITIIISMIILGLSFITVYYSQKQINSPTRIESGQFQELIHAAKNDK